MILARPNTSLTNGHGIKHYDDPIGRTGFTTNPEVQPAEAGAAVLETPLGKLGESSKTVMTETSSSSSNESNVQESQAAATQGTDAQQPESNGPVSGKGTGSAPTSSTRGSTAPRGPMGVSPVPNSFLLIPTHNVSKVIKGEIHNLVAILRGDSRYVAPLRFVEEVPSDEHHPLLSQMKDLYASMTEFEMNHHALSAPEPRVYLPPFCAAVTNRDISASVTGAALTALHKFVMFGFFGTATATSTGTIQPGADGKAFATIANALLNCTFEESSSNVVVGLPGAPGPVSAEPGVQTTPSMDDEETNGASATSSRDDEDVVLKLLDLCSLVVRSASKILATDLIVGLLNTCLHVSHRARHASHLLKSSAEIALGQILIEVFCPSRATIGADGQTIPPRRISPAREPVLIKLVGLLDPTQASAPTDEGVVSSLNLIMVALETLPDALSKSEVALLKNTLCQYLLHWSLSEDLTIMSLSLRIFFNVFQRQRNQLKGALEVFLTSVHIRILDHSKNPEAKEIALENLVEYIKEPGLMKDFFLNFDCDVHCTNLFESICTTLGNIAAPTGIVKGPQGVGTPSTVMVGSGPPGTMANAIAMKAAAAAAEVPVTSLTSLALEGLLAIVDSIARRVGKSSTPSEAASEGEDTAKQRNQVSEEQLQRRRQKKSALNKVAMAFNRSPDGEEWLKIGKDIKVLDGSPASVAKMLFSAPGLDKDVVGNYLSKGPAEAYPFEQEVRTAFAEQCHFSKYMNFASSLRLFLSKFRMPGEAQCIDRFMEAFSKELYRQQGDTSIFKNSDAIFVLAFSTIMLNTDLHNPTLKNVNRMTVDQFVRNNRGINDGFDLPEDMLRELYEQIKHSEIQVQREVVDFMTGPSGATGQDFASAWENVLSKNVAAPIFSSLDEARTKQNQAGLLEKDMFLCIAKPSLKTLCSTFVRSWDDTCVVDTLKGFEQLAKVSTIFGIDKLLNEILKFLLSHGRDYIVGCVTLEYAGIESGAPINQDPNDDETMSIVDQDSPVPHVILKAREVTTIDPRRVDVAGAAAYRGLLVLNMALKMVRALFPKVRDAWPQLIEVLCALRDARALPAGLADLDDFADSNGKVLPLSWFSQESSRRLERYYKGKTEKEQPEETGWFRLNIFASKEEKEKNKPTEEFVTSRGELSANAKMLLQIAEKTEIQVFMLLSSKTRLPIVKHSIMRLLQAVDQWPKTDSPVYEQNVAFALELATRALLANKERANELFPLFLTKFENIAAKIKENQESLASVPFLVERVVSTILRASIHLYSNPEVRPKLHKSLVLLLSLPDDYFIWYIADRMACGLAIILRQSYYLFERPEQWTVIGDAFDILGYYDESRRLVFDGMASTIEFSVPPLISRDLDLYESKLKEKPVLSVGGCQVLINNLVKFIDGTYNEDYSLAVPAMLCIEKTYNHLVLMLQILEKNDMSRHPEDPVTVVPDRTIWYRVAMMLYVVCSAPDTEQSKYGWECFQRHVMKIKVDDLPDERWTNLLTEMVNLQPPIETDVPRMNSFSVLGQVMTKVISSLTKREKNWPVLTEITKTFGLIAEENLYNGPTGAYKPLFDYTLQTVTYLQKEMSKPEFKGEKRYAAWASQHLKEVLDKNAANGDSDR